MLPALQQQGNSQSPPQEPIGSPGAADPGPGPRVREGPVLFRFCGLVSNRVEKNKVEKITITTKLNQIRPVTHLWSRKNRKQKQAASREVSGARRWRRESRRNGLLGSHHCGASGEWGIQVPQLGSQAQRESGTLGAGRAGLVLPSKKAEIGSVDEGAMVAPATTACHRLPEASVTTRPETRPLCPGRI